MRVRVVGRGESGGRGGGLQEDVILVGKHRTPGRCFTCVCFQVNAYRYAVLGSLWARRGGGGRGGVLLWPRTFDRGDGFELRILSILRCVPALFTGGTAVSAPRFCCL